MRTKVRINPAFSTVKSFMKALPATFAENGETLKNDRHQIKVIQYSLDISVEIGN